MVRHQDTYLSISFWTGHSFRPKGRQRGTMSKGREHPRDKGRRSGVSRKIKPESTNDHSHLITFQCPSHEKIQLATNEQKKPCKRRLLPGCVSSPPTSPFLRWNGNDSSLDCGEGALIAVGQRATGLWLSSRDHSIVGVSASEKTTDFGGGEARQRGPIRPLHFIVHTVFAHEKGEKYVLLLSHKC